MTLNFFHRFLPFQAVALLLAAIGRQPRPGLPWEVVWREGRSVRPIHAFVRVTDANGVGVRGLNPTDFALTLDGVPLAQLQAADVTLPPDQIKPEGFGRLRDGLHVERHRQLSRGDGKRPSSRSSMR